MHTLTRTQFLSIPLDEAWAFFSNPGNLCHITPPELDFTVTCPAPEPMYAGQILTYTIRPFAGLPVTQEWVTEITHVREPHFFVDEQRMGPYRFWHHQHVFREVQGGVQMEDEVNYALPAVLVGPLASAVHRLYVRGQLERIFDYRQRVLEQRFGA